MSQSGSGLLRRLFCRLGLHRAGPARGYVEGRVLSRCVGCNRKVYRRAHPWKRDF